MTLRVETLDVKTGERTFEDLTDEEAIARGWLKSAEQIEAEVQEVADSLIANGYRDKALALATVDLAMAAADGTLAGRTRAQVRGLFRDKIIEYLRAARGTV